MAHKKHTQIIFEKMDNPRWREIYPDLMAAYDFFLEIVELRRRNVWTQKELAAKSGLNQSAIARIEAGRANPTLFHLIKIAEALGCKITFESKKKILFK